MSFLSNLGQSVHSWLLAAVLPNRKTTVIGDGRVARQLSNICEATLRCRDMFHTCARPPNHRLNRRFSEGLAMIPAAMEETSKNWIQLLLDVSGGAEGIGG